MLAAPRLRGYPEALALLSRSLRILRGGGGSRQGEGGFLSVQEDPTVGQKTRQILTHTAVPLQHPPSLAGAFETAECVQAVSVLAHSLHGALIDV